LAWAQQRISYDKFNSKHEMGESQTLQSPVCSDFVRVRKLDDFTHKE
jgi:hypothetical protein